MGVRWAWVAPLGWVLFMGLFAGGCGPSDGSLDLGMDSATEDASMPDTSVPDAGPTLTPCTSNVECAGGEVCRTGFCRTSCSSASECTGALSVCDEDAGYCVGCTLDEHCGANEACVDRTCEFFCRGNIACDADEYCVLATGACAERECELSNQCPGGFRCDAFLCVPIDDIVCVADSVTCSGGNTAVLRCNADGTMEAMEACDVDTRCVAAAGSASCDAVLCEANELGCADNATAFVCDATGTVRTDTDCGAGRYCASGACQDQVCTPSSVTCMGAGVLTCDALGAAETFEACSARAECSGSSFGCSCASGSCMTRVCVPASTRCAVTGFQTCSADGLSWGNVTGCAMDETCVPALGTCAPVLCTANSRECMTDVLVVCDATGTVRTTTNCAAASQICTGSGPSAACTPRVCVPGSLACDAGFDSVLECDARGASLSSTACPSGDYCSAGGCVAEVCTPGSLSRCLAGDVRQCNTIGSAYQLLDDCTASETCVENAGGGTCAAHVCTPSAVGCTGDDLVSCAANGLSQSTTDCQAGMSYCSAGACAPWVCTPGSVECTGTGATALRRTCNARGSTLAQVLCGGILGCNGGNSACDTGCGDGVMQSGEACDDGNATNNDACTNACTINLLDRRLAEPQLLLVDTVKRTSSAVAADVDHDGDLDIAVSYDTGAAQVFRNTGGSMSAIWTESPTGLCGRVAWGDPNGDGWMDLAVAHCDAPGGGFAQAFTNVSGTLGTTATWTSARGLWVAFISWMDWDTDGDDDVALGTLTNLGGASRVHRAVGGALETTPGWTDPNVRRVIGFASGDIDGDSLNDLAIAAALQSGSSGASGAYVVRYGAPPTQVFSTDQTGQKSSVAVLDLDDDGDLDLAFVVVTTLYVHLNNAGTLSSSSIAIALPAAGRDEGLAPVDFDGDGDTDLAVGTTSGIVIYENVSGTLISRWTTTNTGTAGYVRVVDWNGDGWPDLLASDTTLGVRVYLNAVAP